MIDFDSIDDFPKLTPDESVHFDSKDKLRRSSELDFECSELEYMYLVAAEEGSDAAENEYKKIRLTPDMNLVMPDKNSLKHRTFKPRRLLWISVTVAAAALVAFMLIVTQDMPENSPVAETNSGEILNPAQNPVTDVIPEQKPEIIPEQKPEIIPVNKARKKIVAQTVEHITAENELPAETAEIDSPSLPAEVVSEVKLSPIASISVPVEMMNKENTVFVYNRIYPQNPVQKTVDNISLAVGKNIVGVSTEIKDTKQNLAQIFEGFKLTNIMSKLSLGSGIDKDIDKWVEKNKDVPFEVFIDYFADNNVTEIFDENGTMVKAVFVANKSLKYKDKKLYQALNN